VDQRRSAKLLQTIVQLDKLTFAQFFTGAAVRAVNFTAEFVPLLNEWRQVSAFDVRREIFQKGQFNSLF